MKAARYVTIAVVSLALFCGLGTGFPALAQQPPAKSQKELNLAAMRADRKALIGENMTLTKEQEEVFWPLFDEYETKMDRIEDRHAKEVRDYVASYRTLTDSDARKKLDEVMAIREATLEVQKIYVPKFRAVLPDIVVTRFFQIDSKLRALVQCDLAQLVPLAQPGAAGGEGRKM
jgi:hypothetical protein